MESLNQRKIVLDRLIEWGIPYRIYEHPPLPTVEVALGYWKDIDAVHCKNLFFRNHKGDRHYLVIFECHQQLAIRDLEQRLRQGKLSFASPERMEKYLGTTPGSVSLLGLVNDTQKHVTLFLDKHLMSAEKLSFHPNDNTASLVIDNDSFRRFMELWGGEYEAIELY